jgi:NAD(P)H-dependent flavin oxidoreductase YrpB (nitropropane dioxygenase family)
VDTPESHLPLSSFPHVSTHARVKSHPSLVVPYVSPSPLKNQTDLQVHVIAAGGIYDGRGLAAMLMFGAQAIWVGTRFVASTEAAAPKKHKDL